MKTSDKENASFFSFTFIFIYIFTFCVFMCVYALCGLRLYFQITPYFEYDTPGIGIERCFRSFWKLWSYLMSWFYPICLTTMPAMI